MLRYFLFRKITLKCILESNWLQDQGEDRVELCFYIYIMHRAFYPILSWSTFRMAVLYKYKSNYQSRLASDAFDNNANNNDVLNNKCPYDNNNAYAKNDNENETQDNKDAYDNDEVYNDEANDNNGDVYDNNGDDNGNNDAHDNNELRDNNDAYVNNDA